MTSFPPLTHATSCILLVMLLLLCILHVWRVCPMLRKAPSLQRNLQIAYELSLGVLFLNLTICARIFAEGKVMVNSLLPVIFDCRVFLYAGILCFILSIPVLVASKQPRVAAEGLLALACTPLFGYAVPNLYFLPLIVASVYFFIRDLFFAHVSNQSKTSSVEAISLTEAVNELSSGVLGANTSGRILFMNDAMCDILGSLSLPTDLANAFVVLHNLNPNWQSDPESKITLPNKKTFLLQVSGQTIGNEPCVLAIAYDITQEEQLNESLNRANAILQAQNKELQKTVSDITEAAHKDAVLQMRARMHDIIGQRLSILHRCLEDDDLSDATVSRKIKAQMPQIRVVIMTGMPEMTFLRQAKDAGADSFVYKNMGTQDLLNVIRSTAEGYSTFPADTNNEMDGIKLTEEEMQILRLVCEAKGRKEIAEALYMSEGTVKRRISEILAKTGYRSILKLAVHAVSNGYIVPRVKNDEQQ